MRDLSVIICTHNPRRDYLERTLNSLKEQTLPRARWELLLIDNASKEPVADGWDLGWHPLARHVREDQLGLTAARLRGIREAQGNLLLFVDDDNVVQADYLNRVIELAIKHPNLGCFGAGVLEPEFEAAVPSAELADYLICLALRTISRPQWSNSMSDSITPWGAGLVVRRDVADKYADVVLNSPLRMHLDRCGSSLNSCGDDEFSWVANDLGYGKGLFPELKITHLITQKRVQPDYLLAIVRGNAYSHALLDLIHGLPVSLPKQPSHFSDVARYLIRGSISGFLHHAHDWWFGRGHSPLEREFQKARRAGIEAALKTFSEARQGPSR